MCSLTCWKIASAILGGDWNVLLKTRLFRSCQIKYTVEDSSSLGIRWVMVFFFWYVDEAHRMRCCHGYIGHCMLAFALTVCQIRCDVVHLKNKCSWVSVWWPHSMQMLLSIIPTEFSRSIVCNLPRHASHMMNDCLGMWPGNHNRWCKLLIGLFSRRSSQAEAIVNVPDVCPVHTQWSSVCMLGWNRMEFHVACNIDTSQGKFHCPSMMISETLAVHGSPVDVRVRIVWESINRFPSGSQ